MVSEAGIFPAELTALRAAGLLAAAALAAYAILRRRSLRNVDVLILLAAGLGLALVAGTELTDKLLAAFSFEKGNGGRILGLAVFAIFVLFGLILRALSQSARNARQVSAVLEGLVWEEFRQAKLPERFRSKIAILVPAYNEAESIGHVLDLMPSEVCGVETAVLVVDDGSRDGTGDVAAEHGAIVARHVINRGGGAALRTGYRLMVDSGAEIVVTLDADGQHLPSEMERLVKPVLEREVDLAHGSRVLGEADRNHFARELGIVFFNRLVSLITRTRVTDCSNGYRAVRATVLPQLVLRQEQFHTSEFMIEAIKRGIPAKEIPVTVEQRLHGHSKKPAVVRYGLGFANAISPHLVEIATRDAGVADFGRVGQVEVGAATGADLDVELDRLVAGGALSFGFPLLAAVEDHGDQAERRQHRADQQPDPEGASLALADDRGGEAEEEGDDEVLVAHPSISAVSDGRSSRPRRCRAERAGSRSSRAPRAPCGRRPGSGSCGRSAPATRRENRGRCARRSCRPPCSGRG